MLKRNKLSIFLVLVVVGLTIYYVSIPNKDVKPTSSPSVVETRYQLYAQTRFDMLEQRNEEINSYEEVVSQVSTVDDEVKLTAIEKINDLKQLTEREIALEKQITTLGYEDSLVIVSDKNCNVKILSNSFSIDEYIDVALLIKGEFGNECTISIDVNPIN